MQYDCSSKCDSNTVHSPMNGSHSIHEDVLESDPEPEPEAVPEPTQMPVRGNDERLQNEYIRQIENTNSQKGSRRSSRGLHDGNDWANWKELIKDAMVESKEYLSNRDNLKRSLRKLLSQTKDELHMIRNQLKANKERSVINTNQLQHSLTTFESKLTVLTTRWRMDIEQCNEQSEYLISELVSFDDKITCWMDEESSTALSANYHDRNPVDQIDQKQRTLANKERLNRHMERQRKIGAIDKQLIAMGGRCGGWDSRDHDAFIRVWTQSGLPISVPSHVHAGVKYDPPVETTEAFARKAAMMLPGKDHEEIMSHIRWQVSNLNLLAEKRAILQDWKSDKDIGEAVEEELFDDINYESSRTASQNLELADKEVERAAVKERVMKWKLLKEQEKIAKEEKEKEESTKAKQLVEEKTKRKQQITRIQIEHWKKEDAEQRQALIAAEAVTSERRASSADPAEIRRRRERDLMLAQKRHERVERYQQEHIPRAEKINGINVEPVAIANKDPDRLRLSTAASRSHTLGKDELDSAEHKRASSAAHSRPIAFSGRDLGFGLRARPAWAAHMN